MNPTNQEEEIKPDLIAKEKAAKKKKTVLYSGLIAFVAILAVASIGFSASLKTTSFVKKLPSNPILPATIQVAPGKKITVNLPTSLFGPKKIQLCGLTRSCSTLATTASSSATVIIPQAPTGNATIQAIPAAGSQKILASANINIIRSGSAKIVTLKLVATPPPTIMPPTMPPVINDRIYFQDPEPAIERPQISVNGSVDTCTTCPCNINTSDDTIPLSLIKIPKVQAAIVPPICAIPEITTSRLATFKPLVLPKPVEVPLTMFYPQESQGKVEMRPEELIKYFCDAKTIDMGCSTKNAIACYFPSKFAWDPNWTFEFSLQNTANCAEKKMQFGPFKIKDCAGNTQTKTGIVAAVSTSECRPVEQKITQPAKIHTTSLNQEQISALWDWEANFNSTNFTQPASREQWQERVNALNETLKNTMTHEQLHAQYQNEYEQKTFDLSQNVAGLIGNISIDQSSSAQCSKSVAAWLIDEAWMKKMLEFEYDLRKSHFNLDCHGEIAVSTPQNSAQRAFFCLGTKLDIEAVSGVLLQSGTCATKAQKLSTKEGYVQEEMKTWYSLRPKPSCPPATCQ